MSTDPNTTMSSEEVSRINILQQALHISNLDDSFVNRQNLSSMNESSFQERILYLERSVGSLQNETHAIRYR